MSDFKIISSVNEYYSQKIVENGLSSNGVDWNSIESHYLRFDVLTNHIKEDSFSVLDFGCGYGELINYLKNIKNSNFQYIGFDISSKMIEVAKIEFKGFEFTTDLNSISEKADYVIANGIFNVKLDTSFDEWTEYVIRTLELLDKHSKKGFSFNILTSYSDKEYMKNYLYYADPLYFFDICKRKFSKFVNLIHNYPLYEFTILVTK